MSSNEIRYYVDNLEKIIEGINTIFGNLPEEVASKIENENNIDEIYNVILKFSPDFCKENRITLSSFKLVMFLSDPASEIYSDSEYKSVLKSLADTYGNDLAEIIDIDPYSFKMSIVEPLLSFGDSKYSDIYKTIFEKLLLSADFMNTFKVIKSVDSSFIDEKVATEILEKNNYNTELVNELLQILPNTAIQGNSFVKNVIEKIPDEVDKIIDNIPSVSYDTELVDELVEKVGIEKAFLYVPLQYKTINLCEEYIDSLGTYNKDNLEKLRLILHRIPIKSADPTISDKEYTSWLDNLIIRKMTENREFAFEIFNSLDYQMMTVDLCQKVADILPFKKSDGKSDEYRTNEFLSKIPSDARTQRLYETLASKTPYVLRKIPAKSFVPELSQEQYDKWVENLILLSISKNDDLEAIDKSIPVKRLNENIWNKLMDKSLENNKIMSICWLENVPLEILTPQMIERAMKDINFSQVGYAPCVDVNLDSLSYGDREEYAKWLSSFTEEQKQKYREWYEKLWLDYLKKHPPYNGDNVFDLNVPKEGMTMPLCYAYANASTLAAYEIINRVPLPKNEKEIKEYQDFFVNILKKYGIHGFDYLESIPKEYINDEIIKIGVQSRKFYLKYAAPTAQNYDELLNLAFKDYLGGERELTKSEIELMRKFFNNNVDLFSTLSLKILDPKIVAVLGEDNVEKISRYRDVQDAVIRISENSDRLETFGFAFENLKGNNHFVGPLIEKLTNLPVEFSNIVAQRLEKKDIPFTDYEKAIISYLALNPYESEKITSYNDILTFVARKDNELMSVINNPNSTLLEVKNAYFERIVGLNYNSVLNLVTMYGNDPEQLLQNYMDMDGKTFQERGEREALEIIIKLKALMEVKDIDEIRNDFKRSISILDGEPSFVRYQKVTKLEDALKRAYGREVVVSLSKDTDLFPMEERQFEGEKYLVRKLDRDFNRMISVLGAYRQSEVSEGDMYDRWNTNKMADNHALCYSLINQSNPGTALTGHKDGIIISVNGFSPEALLAAAPYDLYSDNRQNSIVTRRQQRFFTTKNMPNQSRGIYSEYDIEIQDVLADGEEYKKIQPASIICFEEADEESIKASIELSKKLGRPVPIEIIDRRKLAEQEMQYIQKAFDNFKSGEKIDVGLVKEIITRFENVRNAHIDSSNKKLTHELLGAYKFCSPDEEDKSAPFHIGKLNEMLAECLSNVEQKINKGETQEGLAALREIKKIIFDERQKVYLQKTMYLKAEWLGIDTNIDYMIDELQRTYGKINVEPFKGSKSLQAVAQMNKDGMSSISFDAWCKSDSLPEQLTASQVIQLVDIDKIQEDIAQIHAQGYYQGNKAYDEEHVARVTLYGQAIAKMEGFDDKTKRLLAAASEYYSCGRRLDVENVEFGRFNARISPIIEEHGAYSAKLAGKALKDKYSETELGIIQATIELKSIDEEYYSEEYAEKLDELSDKYGLTKEDMDVVEKITACIRDSVVLDRTRFSELGENSNVARFHPNYLRSDTAKKLIEFSYSIQDILAEAELDSLSPIVSVDFEVEKENILNSFDEYTRSNRYLGDVTLSPIVRCEYLKSLYQETLDMLSSGEEVVKEENEEVKAEAATNQEIRNLKAQRRELRRRQFDEKVAELGLQEEMIWNLEQLFQQQENLEKQILNGMTQSELEQASVTMKSR